MGNKTHPLILEQMELDSYANDVRFFLQKNVSASEAEQLKVLKHTIRMIKETLSDEEALGSP